MFDGGLLEQRLVSGTTRALRLEPGLRLLNLNAGERGEKLFARHFLVATWFVHSFVFRLERKFTVPELVLRVNKQPFRPNHCRKADSYFLCAAL